MSSKLFHTLLAKQMATTYNELPDKASQFDFQRIIIDELRASLKNENEYSQVMNLFRSYTNSYSVVNFAKGFISKNKIGFSSLLILWFLLCLFPPFLIQENRSPSYIENVFLFTRTSPRIDMVEFTFGIFIIELFALSLLSIMIQIIVNHIRTWKIK